MALTKIHDILSTEAGNMSTTVNFLYGDPFELETENYHLDQTNPTLGVLPWEITTTFRQNDQIDAEYRITVQLMKYQPLDGKQADRAADMDTLADLTDEYIYRLRKNADIIDATAGRKEITAVMRPRYAMTSAHLYGWETTFDLNYTYNCNIDNS